MATLTSNNIATSANATETPAMLLERIHAQGASSADDSLKVIEPVVGVPVAQGDLNLWRLNSLPATAVEAAPMAQLAPGTTRGARHCIRQEDMKNVKFYRLSNATPLHGAVMYFSAPVTIEHPEHGDQLWPVGFIAVTYQRLHSIELKRNAD